MNSNKSYVKKIKDFDYKQKLVLSEFKISSEMVKYYYQNFKKTFKELSEKKIWYKVRDSIMRDKLFSVIIRSIIPCYEILILPEDINKIAQQIKTMPAFSTMSDIDAQRLAKQTIEKDLIIRDLAREWQITVPDKQLRLELRKFYNWHPQKVSFEEYIKDNGLVANLNNILLQENVVQTLLSKFKVDVDFDKIKASLNSVN